LAASLAQGLGPENKLRRETHDQENQRIAVAAEALIFDVDSVRFRLRHGALQQA
jgi:hypothetical protein